MLGILIIAHGNLSEGFKNAAEVIMGSVNKVETICLHQEESISKIGDKISQSIQKLNQENGVVILTDIVGASPYNQSLLAVNKLDHQLKEMIYVIGGVNLPMVIETLNQQLLGNTAAKAVQAIIAEGTKSMQLWPFLLEETTEAEETF